MRRIIAIGVVLALLLTGCAGKPQMKTQQFSVTFLDLFDTVTVITGLAESEEIFHQKTQQVYDALLTYHRLFDIYTSYDGINNLKTVNDRAGIAPVTVDRAIIELLLDCRSYYDLTDGRVDVTMGAVLKLWHEARNAGLDDPGNAYLPEGRALKEAALHRGWDGVEIDEGASTVYISDPQLRLDVGAVAKGWAAQRAAEKAAEGLLLSVGGNVCATGPKDDKGTAWVVGVQNPDGGDQYLHTLNLQTGSLVTSGDYQRGYTVGGVWYHHIIDPDTLYPSTYWRSVSIVCGDSGLADALSTALFLMPVEAGQDLLDRCDAAAMWVDGEGDIFYSTGFEDHIRS